VSRCCVSIVLKDGMTANVQFPHPPTRAEIEKTTASMNLDIELLKAQFKKPRTPKENL
jgi:hypothetical protein